MYLSHNKHLLSNTLLIVAIVNVVAELANSLSRAFIMRNGDIYRPDMANETIWKIGVCIFILQFTINALVFLNGQKKLKKINNMMSEEEMMEIRMLQKDYIPDKISTLDLKTNILLLKVWALIILGVNAIYEFTSIAYKDFINNILSIVNLSIAKNADTFHDIYNSTHGFKYMGMLIAIFMGIVITGLCLNDKFMQFISLEVIVAFLVAFLFIGRSEIALASRTVGVVWTSVIYHGIQTFGILSLSIYLRIRYKGM